jgi:hypothetical protein
MVPDSAMPDPDWIWIHALLLQEGEHRDAILAQLWYYDGGPIQPRGLRDVIHTKGRAFDVDFEVDMRITLFGRSVSHLLPWLCFF